MSAIPTKQLEFWLAGWTKSHNGGTKVTFTINDEDLPYFENATIRKGKHAGQRYAVVMVQLQDDETPDPESIRPLAPGACPPARVPNPGIAKAHELAEASAEGSEVRADAIRRMSKFPVGYCGLAVRWCDDAHFQGWLEDAFPEQWSKSITMVKMSRQDADAQRAAVVIKLVCHVSSRSELDTSDTAHALFKEHIFKPYVQNRHDLGMDA